MKVLLITLLQQMTNVITFTVEDNGLGIPEHVIPVFFDPGYTIKI